MIGLAEDIALKCFEVGADALLNLYTDRYYFGYMHLLSKESLSEPSKFCVALTETSTVEVNLGWEENPRVLDDIPGEKIAAMSEGERKAHYPPGVQRKVRVASLEHMHITKERAREYGFGLRKWGEACYRAAAVDYPKLSETCSRVASLLQDGRQVRITAPGGTQIECRLAGRRAYVDDGVIDDEDIAEGRREVSIPAGRVIAVPTEGSADGKVVSNLTARYSGRKIGRVVWVLEHGRLLSFDIGRGGETLKEHYGSSSGDKDKFAFLQVGTNPRAVYGYTIDQIVAGAVSLGIGGNEAVGGTNSSAFSMRITLKQATLEVDGKEIVKAGVLHL